MRQFDAGDIIKARLNERITSAGFCPTENGLLTDLELRARCNFLRIWNYDFMHTAFQAGFMSTAMWLVCSRVSANTHGNSKCESLVTFLTGCQFPLCMTGLNHKLKNVFDAVMIPKHEARHMIVANASIQLSLYPLLRDWARLESEGAPAVLPDVVVFLAACEIIDLYKKIKHRRISTQCAKPLLRSALDKLANLHKVRYGTRYITPKFFWMDLICARLDDTEWLFDMFCIERQHQLVRPHAELVKNLRLWEESVLLRVLDARLTLLPKGKDAYCLEGRQVVINGAISGFMADKCVCGGAKLSCDDIVKHSHENRVGVVVACIQSDDGRMLLRVELMQNRGRSAWQQTHVVEV